jgi:hypothetical protein
MVFHNYKIKQTKQRKKQKRHNKKTRKNKRYIKKNKKNNYWVTTKYGGNIDNNCEYDSQNINWPKNFGCIDNETEVTLEPDTMIDRFGNETGFFLGDVTSSYDQRSLPSVKPDYNCEPIYNQKIQDHTLPYNLYKVIKPFNVKICTIAPWFEHTGYGKQYRLFVNSISDVNEQNMISPKDKPFPAPEQIPGIKTPNISEMIQMGYLTRIHDISDIPKFK